MPAPVFIGDELSALGARLAGARVFVPDEQDAAHVFAVACAEAEIVFITAGYANRLRSLQASLFESRPLIVVVPDAYGRSRPPDLVRELHRALGVET